MKNLFTKSLTLKETNMIIKTDRESAIDEAIKAVILNREILENYIKIHPNFKTTFKPIKVDKDAHLIIKMMAIAAEKADVGPMAAVAGAIADLSLDAMLKIGARICVVENGGEISANSIIPIDIGIYAGHSILSEKIGFRLQVKDFPVGITTSSGIVGHAISFRVADAATVVADNATLADAAATAIGNEVQGKDSEKSIQNGLEVAETIE